LRKKKVVVQRWASILLLMSKSIESTHREKGEKLGETGRTRLKKNDETKALKLPKSLDNQSLLTKSTSFKKKDIKGFADRERWLGKKTRKQAPNEGRHGKGKDDLDVGYFKETWMD